MSIRSSLSLLLAAVTLSACGAPRQAPTAYAPQSVQRFQRQSSNADLGAMKDWLPVLKHLYGEEFADALQTGQIPPDLQKKLKLYGPRAFQLLSQDPAARQSLYPASDSMVIREFTKPAQPDNVPPLSAQENKQLLQSLKHGDVILCGNNGSFIHGALYIGDGKIVHALATQPDMKNAFRGVVEESWNTYVRRSERDTVVVLRSKMSAGDILKSIRYARAQKGKGYDSLFLNASDERFYCTELVWKALQVGRSGPRVYSHKVKYGWSIVSVEDFMDSPDFETVWQRNYQRPQPGRRHRY